MSNLPPSPDPQYRVNPTRAIEVFGEFTEELGNSLVSRINVIRSGPDAANPITVYINSRGGLTRVLNIIHGALSTKDQNGNAPRIITVAAGDAASAGAYLLAYGHYALAYPYSAIHFHGVRANEIELTAEDAAGVSKMYASINRDTANRLARRMIGRMSYRYLAARKEVRAMRKRSQSKSHKKSDLDCFIDFLGHKLSRHATVLLKRTKSDVTGTYNLLDGVFKKMKPFGKKTTQTEMDFKVLRTLISYELPIYNQQGKELDESGITDLLADYLILRDFAGGEHTDIIQRSIYTWGSPFLTDGEFVRYRKYKEAHNEKAAQKLLKEKAARTAEPCFRFVVALCRNLLKGENRLTASDAYWLGIVDEVVGTKLSGARMYAENALAEELAKQATPSSPAALPSVAEQPPTTAT